MSCCVVMLVNIFFTDSDRRYFYYLLKVGVSRYGFRVHAFSLMGNHVHLAIQVGDTPLAKVAQLLNIVSLTASSQYFNRDPSSIMHMLNRKGENARDKARELIAMLIRSGCQA